MQVTVIGDIRFTQVNGVYTSMVIPCSLEHPQQGVTQYEQVERNQSKINGYINAPNDEARHGQLEGIIRPYAAQVINQLDALNPVQEGTTDQDTGYSVEV
jgi:hypothetical protein